VTSAARLVAAIVALAGAAASCASQEARGRDLIVVGITSDPSDLDPRFGLDDVSQKIHQLLYDGLLAFSDDLRMAPGLAETFVQLEPTRYRATLRRGVRFHDGHELTSADVVYTFRSLIDPGTQSPRRGGLRELAAVDAIDRYTVDFRLHAPYTSFPVNLALGILPEGAGLDLRVHPVGTGPYRFVRRAADDEIELEAFDGYWQGAPRNAGVRLRVVPDEVMRALELRKGSMDIVVNDVSPDLFYQLRQDAALQTTTGPGVDVQYLGVNIRDPALGDRRVRQALAQAIDREAIVTHLRRGLARPADGLLPPLSWAYEPGVASYPHDPAAARRLLDEAGYPDPDGDGPRPRLRLTLKVSNLEYNRLQAAVIQEDLRRVGIQLDVRTYEFATLFADVVSGNFQLYTLQWTAAALADPDILRRVFHSSQVPPAGFNRGGYHNRELDGLLERAAASQDDTVRKALYAEAQRRIAEDLPYIHLWHKTNFAIARRGLSGVALNPYADFLFLRHVARDPAARTH